MASDPHKRTKSGVARSLLSRVSSKTTASRPVEEDDDDNSNGSSMDQLSHSSSVPQATSQSGASSQLHPSASQPSLAHRTPSSRHRPHLSTTMSPSDKDKDQSPHPSAATAAAATGSSPVSSAVTSLEQSVKLFKVFEALRSGDTAAISKAIREQSAGSNADGDEGKLEGTTVLHLAIQCAETPVVEYVLSSATGTEGGLDINARDREGNTPLHVASTLGRGPIVRLLLDNSHANDSLVNYSGQTALDLARTPEIFQQLQLARSVFLDTAIKKIQQLVAAGDYATLEKLLQDTRIKSTVDVNIGELASEPETVATGGTLMHEAARKKDTKLIQILLLNGADPFRRDRKGKLPQDVTKDDRTRAIIKKSPAAAAAQRGIQEKTILAGAQSNAPAASDTPGNKEGREMKGYLKKWTNYTGGWKLRWFVLEDGVLSYYKHQDDAGSACRGAINMKISKLHMDPQDKLRFEIHGKSSVKYHLRANHQVEAKRWFWALNNAIQWAKDEAREDERRQRREDEVLQQMRVEQTHKHRDFDEASIDSSRIGSRPPPGGTSVYGGDESGNVPSYEPSTTGAELSRFASAVPPASGPDDTHEDEDYDDDDSGHEHVPATRDAFNIAAQSAKLQLDMLSQISAGLQSEKARNPTMSFQDPVALAAVSSIESALSNLKSLIGDLVRIGRDRDAYWQYRLDREQNVRRLWEESMAKVAKEQEELQANLGESEEKRRKTKRALRDALEGVAGGDASRPETPPAALRTDEKAQLSPGKDSLQAKRLSVAGRRQTIADLDLSDDESDEEDEEFFDAVGAGEVEVLEELPPTSPPLADTKDAPPPAYGEQMDLAASIAPSFKGYEDGIRKRLKMDADDRPKISLWGILKSMIGKDMTKMTLPVSFNEPTSLLQRVAEDMEYTDLLDTAADRADPTERMLYVAAFAASEYASTIGRVAKPFNPLLAETYEYCRPDKGFRFFIEQVSHHPPIGAAHAESPKWDYYGESAVKSKFYGKSFDINPLGTWFLRLRPTTNAPKGGSELYTWKKVTSSVIGIITGNPTVDNYGLMEIKNWTTGETCILDFKPRGWKASSAYQVTGRVSDAEGKVRWSIGGRWNDKIYARLTPGYEADIQVPKSGSSIANAPTNLTSGQAFQIWEAHARPTGIPFNLTPFVVTLNDINDNLRRVIAPTDTRLRPDQRAMEDGEYDFAATEKNRVEEKQRAARREREARGEEFTPRWFKKTRCSITGEQYWDFGGEYWKMREAVANGGEWQGLEDIFSEEVKE